MRYARVKNNIVVDVIILDDPSLESIFAEGFDFIRQVLDEPGNPQTADCGDDYIVATDSFARPQFDENGNRINPNA